MHAYATDAKASYCKLHFRCERKKYTGPVTRVVGPPWFRLCMTRLKKLSKCEDMAYTIQSNFDKLIDG